MSAALSKSSLAAGHSATRSCHSDTYKHINMGQTAVHWFSKKPRVAPQMGCRRSVRLVTAVFQHMVLLLTTTNAAFLQTSDNCS